MALELEEIEKPVRKIRKLLKKMPASPTPEQIHDFRTNSRRLEASMRVLSLDSGQTGQQVIKKVSRLRKRAGKVRDMDVLTGCASNIDHLSGEEDCGVRLLEHLGAQRLKQAQKFHAAAEQVDSKLIKGLKSVGKKVEKIVPSRKAAKSAASSASSDVAAAALKLVTELASISRVDKSNLHSYRLQVKELRNLLKMSNNSSGDFVKQLGEVKDRIGEWHDWLELTAIAEDVLDHGVQCHLIREIRKNREQKYKKAYATFEGMRQKYLRQFDQRGGARSVRSLKKPAESVLSATAALAA